MSRIEADARPIQLPEEESVTKIIIRIDVTHFLDELKLFDALFNIDLQVNGDTYYYSFVQRNIIEPIIEMPMFVQGVVTEKDQVSYTVQMSYIKKL